MWETGYVYSSPYLVAWKFLPDYCIDISGYIYIYGLVATTLETFCMCNRLAIGNITRTLKFLPPYLVSPLIDHWHVDVIDKDRHSSSSRRTISAPNTLVHIALNCTL